MGKIEVHAANITENSTIRLGWAIVIISSCVFAALRVGWFISQIEEAKAVNCKQDIVNDKQDAILSEHDKRLTGCETWSQVHEARVHAP